MRKSNFSDEQIVAILAQEAAGTTTATELCRKHGVSRQTLQRWKSKFSGMGVLEVRRLKALEDENRRLKQLVGDQALDIQALKAVIAKKL
jgi:putative transposase